MPTALLSVYDKTGIVELAAGLHAAGWRIVSSGGTAAAVAAAGVEVTDLADLTGLPAILDHRVVTLHPKVHGGLLADPTNPQHQADMAEHGIEAIDLVVVNLYPFSSNPSIELIDIGGPAMVRAAAKNHAHVGVVVDPADYGSVLDEIDGARSAVRLPLVAGSPAMRSRSSPPTTPPSPTGSTPPRPTRPTRCPWGCTCRSSARRHCATARTRTSRARATGSQERTSWWDTAVQHQGKELSYLNLYDTEAAWKLVQRFGRPAVRDREARQPVRCGGRRHHRAGLRRRPTHATRSVRSAASSRSTGPSPRQVAEALAPVFTEVVVAPSFEPEALEVFATKPNLRLLSAARAARRRRSTCAASTAGCSCSRSTPCRPTDPAGRWSRSRSPRPSSGPTSSSRGRCARW